MKTTWLCLSRVIVTRWWAAALPLACCGCGLFAPSIPLQGPTPAIIQLPDGGVEVPAQISGNYTLVEVSVNGSGPYTFVLDTGASYAAISPRIADQFPQNVLGTMTTVSPFGTDSSQLVRIDTLEMGEIHFETFDAAVADMDQFPFDEMGITVDGIVSLLLFKTVLLTIDYPGRKVLVQTGVLPPADGCKVFGLQRDEYDRLTTAVTVAGRTEQALIDTGFDGLLILPSTFDDLSFLEPPTTRSISWVTGPSSALYGRLEDGSLALGCVASTTTWVLVGGETAILGAAAFQRFAITIDQESGLIWFQD